MSDNGSRPNECKLNIRYECPFKKIVDLAILRYDVNTLTKVCGLCLKATYAVAHVKNEVRVVNTL